MLQLYDPFSLQNGVRQPFPGNIIPKDRFDPQAVKAIAAYSSGPGGMVEPNVTAAPGTVAYVLNNFVTTTGSRIQPADKFSVKLDQFIKEKDRISFYYGYNRNLETPGPAGPPTLPGYFHGLQRSEPGQQRLPLHLGPQLQRYPAEPFSRRRQ